jgi:penicillin amidase
MMVIWFKRLALGLLALLLLAIAAGWWLLRGSLPRLDGDVPLAGLSAPVAIQRDRLGVVTIDAVNATDAMRALGYVHAQERFFEMDLMRRSAAGELSELFGAAALDADRSHRVHRLRARVDRNLNAILGDERQDMEAYVAGVNAGLSALRVRPWPYLLLGTQPRPWRLSDSALVGYAMYFDLQDSDNDRELALWKLRPHLPSALFALLTRDGSSWDAPMAGAVRGDAVLPDASQADLRRLPVNARVAVHLPQPREVGSNSFAVGGALTDGRAILANDMHLTLRAPNIWFRARLRHSDPRAASGGVDVSGFTLPGLPVVVVGSNGHVAWGFTNSYTDQADWQVLPPCHPKPCADETAIHERIAVAGADPVDFQIDETAWGPVLHTLPDGRRLALRWSAQLPGSLQLSFAGIARAQDLPSAFAVADHAAIPAQNFLVVDRAGEAGWRIFGPLPQRGAGCDPFLATTPAACAPWAVSSSRSPQLPDAPSHRAWTANNRIVDGDALKRLGDGGYALGARARQIRNDLFAKDQVREIDLLRIQLDDRALFLQRWWQLLRDEAAHPGLPALRALSAAASTWQGRASPDSVSYRIVRAWRLAVHDRIAAGLTDPARAAMGNEFSLPDLPQFEGTVWPLVTQRPPHLLPPAYANWDALFEDAAREVRDELLEQGPLAQRNWGERNTAHICHPLARALPRFVAPLLCMPFEPLPGDTAMPRVQQPDMGASERMVVSPGHEADGFIHMPGGQSGHPLSPYWGAGHEDWVHGRPTPFLPGKAEHTLRLAPGATGTEAAG